MKFYSIINKKTLDQKEINKVFFNEDAATNFVKMLNTKNKGKQEYCFREFEYKPTKEEIERYKISACRPDKRCFYI